MATTISMIALRTGLLTIDPCIHWDQNKVRSARGTTSTHSTLASAGEKLAQGNPNSTSLAKI